MPGEGHCHASVFGVGDVFDIVVPAIAAGHALVALIGGRAGLAQSGDGRRPRPPGWCRTINFHS